MGIDIYARWSGITREELDAQGNGGFDIPQGRVGYATCHLCYHARLNQ
jgi:hypothetical protein